MNILWWAQICIEVLPLSSSGHLRLIVESARIRGYTLHAFTREEMWLAHLPTLCMLMFVYRVRMRAALRILFRFPHRFMRMCVPVASVTFITGITMVSMKVLCEDTICIPLSVSFVLNGLLVICSGLCRSGTRSSVGWIEFVGIGLVQGLAASCAVSRLGAVYTVQRIYGVSHRHAWVRSWIYALPLYGGAVLLAGPVSVWQIGLSTLVSWQGLVATLISGMLFLGMERYYDSRIGQSILVAELVCAALYARLLSM